jgi:hypothetical protein
MRLYPGHVTACRPCAFGLTAATLLVALRPLGIAIAAVFVSACGSMKPSDFAQTRPVFRLEKFYAGHTRSQGFIENRAGTPMKRVATETWGRMVKGALQMTQDVTINDGKPVRRTWRMRRLDAHHYEAHSENVVGTARGEDWGNTSRLSYILALEPGNPLSHVRMTHWMMLQPDQRTMLNRVVVSKAGVVVAQITEIFQSLEN